MGRLCCSRYEREARQRGWLRIAGLDEAGRGSLFGPVVAAAVILNPRAPHRRPGRFQKTDARTAQRTWPAHPRTRAGLGRGRNRRQPHRRLEHLSSQPPGDGGGRLAAQSPLPDYLLLDAIELDLPIEQKALIHGDARSVSIAAASILAKVERDRRMEEFDEIYPQYGLAQHKGYGTPEHLDALRRHGPTPLHRFSYAPVKDARCWGAQATQDPLPLAGSPEALPS